LQAQHQLDQFFLGQPLQISAITALWIQAS
jgi:hypothetical protein